MAKWINRRPVATEAHVRCQFCPYIIPGNTSELDDNIKMDVRQIGWVGMDWIYLAQGRNKRQAAVNALMNLRDPQNANNFFS